MKKLLITGAGGQLATEYERSQPLDGWEFLFLDKKTLDITNLQQVEEVMNLWNFDAVLNLAAYTNVEKAEKQELELAFNVNATGPKNLAITCKKHDIPLIHISTDYVFDGEIDLPYTEESLENPLNQYGRTKFLGEKWIQDSHDWFYIIRTSWVYSNHYKNFFTTMLSLAQERAELNVIEDQYGSPTSTKELCRAIDAILSNLDKSKSGVYHFSGIGKASWKDFATEIFNQTRVSVKVNGISSDSWQSKVTRPKNSYMSSEKFRRVFQCEPQHWKNALKEIVIERKILPIKVGDIVSAQSVELVILSTDWLKRVAKLAPIDNLGNVIELPFEMITLNNE